MIRAYHAIFTAYGFWLPNDPRGSWSDYVRSWELLRFGKATKVSTRRSVAARPHSSGQRLAAKRALRYPPVRFTGQQARCIAAGFRVAIDESDYVLYACSILPEHVHLVIARHHRRPKQIIGHLKARATQQLAGGVYKRTERLSGGDFPGYGYAVQEAVDTLDALYHGSPVSVKEIAGILGIKRGAAQERLRKARDRGFIVALRGPGFRGWIPTEKQAEV